MINYSLYQIKLPFIILSDYNNDYSSSIYLITCPIVDFFNELKVEDTLTKNFSSMKAESLFLKLRELNEIIQYDDIKISSYVLNKIFQGATGRLDRMLSEINDIYPDYTDFVVTLFYKFGINKKHTVPDTPYFIWDLEVLDIRPMEEHQKRSQYPIIEGLGPKFKDFEDMVRFWGF